MRPYCAFFGPYSVQLNAGPISHIVFSQAKNVRRSCQLWNCSLLAQPLYGKIPLPLRASVNRVVFFQNFKLFVKTFSKPFEKGDPSSSLINQPPKIDDFVCLSQKFETGLNLSMKSIDQHCNQKSFVSTKHQDNCGLQVAILLFPIVSCVSR